MTVKLQAKEVSFEFRKGTLCCHMTWGLRRGFKMAAILDFPQTFSE